MTRRVAANAMDTRRGVSEFDVPLESADRRYPHKPFNASIIRDFLGRREIDSVELLPAGRTNTNYKLMLNDGQACVLRLHSRGRPEREAYVMDLARKLVPVPRVLARGEAWSVLEFLDGESLANAPEHSGSAAEALARISTVTFVSPGWVNPDGTVSPFPFGGDEGLVTDQLEHPEVRKWLGSQTISAIRTMRRREAGRLAELDAECCLVHGDFNPANILVRRGEISGILDWEWSHSGTPYMDIGNLLRNTDPQYHSRIQHGLEAGGMRLPDDWKQRAELVDLSSHLEFLTSDRAEAFKRQCVMRVERCLAAFGCGRGSNE